MNNYKKFAYAIQIFNFIIIPFSIFITFAKWFLPSIYKWIGGSCEFNSDTFSYFQKFSGLAIESVSVIIFIVALLYINKLMEYIKNNEYFSLNTISLLKKITKMALIYTCYAPIAYIILSVITSLNNKPGERVIALAIGTTDIVNIMIFCFMFMIVSVFQKGYELKHEQELTI